jgi:hypothetical protein
MKIRIVKNALELYIKEHTDYRGRYTGKDNWKKAMKKIAGKILEVDTEMLFKHEFNTKPIPGVSKKGIRVFEEYVEEVIDDIRHGKARCELCNSISESIKVCSNCGSKNYLEVFFGEDEYE